MAMAAEFFHELVFRSPCPPGARDVIMANTDDLLGCLKFSNLRRLDRRAALTSYLLDQVRMGAVACDVPPSFDDEHRALYLQSNFFTTGVAQLAEGVAHLLLALAHHPGVQERMAAEPGDTAFYDRAINESLRMYPLFGISQRITTGPIDVGGETLPAGSVLFFDYEAYHRSGFADPERFDPDRWLTLCPRDVTFIPFGVPGNRPCPARGLSMVFLRAVTAEVLQRFVLYSSAGHTRSMPNRAPCLLLPRAAAAPRPKAALAAMRVRDDWENVARSLTQLVLGSIIVADARRRKLCQRHHASTGRDPHVPRTPESRSSQPKRRTDTRHD
ncbi:cytochrome P450 [Streptomyces sp. URMC 124]|uniref:cytochrome P450 n=1 Tax=Streptomyces sp. URMC 124 TaxID=3423405 RepID=UPI003F1AC458